MNKESLSCKFCLVRRKNMFNNTKVWKFLPYNILMIILLFLLIVYPYLLVDPFIGKLSYEEQQAVEEVSQRHMCKVNDIFRGQPFVSFCFVLEREALIYSKTYVYTLFQVVHGTVERLDKYSGFNRESEPIEYNPAIKSVFMYSKAYDNRDNPEGEVWFNLATDTVAEAGRLNLYLHIISKILAFIVLMLFPTPLLDRIFVKIRNRIFRRKKIKVS